ncbi:hypothetical protein SAMN05216224_102693 [Thioclava dalianensis]|nr:hypothetical protein SAMN05216224_102693 [Thioclava dalianensis]
MVKSNYKVSLVTKGKEALWASYHGSGTPTKDATNAAKNGSLGQTMFVVAESLEEAKAMARREMPGYSVVDAGTARIGGP